MLSIAKMSGGQGEYYASLAQEDYYLAGGEPPGMWLGSGAEKLGLRGKVEREEFLDIFDGFHRGKALVQSAGKDKHRPGWDLTFSAPKSVSVAWSQADRETALEIQAAHLSAVEKAIQYVDENTAWTRRGRGGQELERCSAVFATFEHGTSRAQDPQLHTHALLLNIGVREDGSSGTLETHGLYDHKMAAGAIYRAELARQLERRLGFTFRRERSWFEIQGVLKELIEEFSKRRQEIESELDKTGQKSARAAEIAALNSRRGKGHIAREELYERWRAVGREYGWSLLELFKIVKGPQPERDSQRELKAAAATAVAKLTENQSYFTERELVRFVAEEAQTLAAGADAVLKEVKSLLQSPQIVRLGLRFHEPIFTTPEILRLEVSLMNTVKAMSFKTWQPVREEVIGELLTTRSTIQEEQAKAVRHITQGSDSIATVTGMAGTGKTYMLNAAREALERSGYRVLGAAPSGKAARGLAEGAKIESFTIAKVLKDLGESRFALIEKRKLFPKAPDWNPASKIRLPRIRPRLKDLIRLTDKTVLVIDEAGMVGTAQMKKLVDACDRAGAKLVLVGDEKQLQPIAAGGPFAAIAKELGTVTLSEIVRQREDWQRESVKDFASGKACQALSTYAERGLVSVSADPKAARAALLSFWKQDGVTRPADNLIVAATNSDVTTLNRDIQELRAREGFLTGAAAKVSGEKFYAGDRILFTRNSRALRVDNGSLGTVKSVSRFTGQMKVRLDNGQERSFSPKNYEHLKLGYAVTTHKAQGMTAENVFILTSESMQDRELSYVQASRGRGETRFFTTEGEAGKNLTELSRRMERSHQKQMAIQAIHEQELGQ